MDGSMVSSTAKLCQKSPPSRGNSPALHDLHTGSYARQSVERFASNESIR